MGSAIFITCIVFDEVVIVEIVLQINFPIYFFVSRLNMWYRMVLNIQKWYVEHANQSTHNFIGFIVTANRETFKKFWRTLIWYFHFYAFYIFYGNHNSCCSGRLFENKDCHHQSNLPYIRSYLHWKAMRKLLMKQS